MSGRVEGLYGSTSVSSTYLVPLSAIVAVATPGVVTVRGEWEPQTYTHVCKSVVGTTEKV